MNYDLKANNANGLDRNENMNSQKDSMNHDLKHRTSPTKFVAAAPPRANGTTNLYNGLSASTQRVPTDTLGTHFPFLPTPRYSNQTFSSKARQEKTGKTGKFGNKLDLHRNQSGQTPQSSSVPIDLNILGLGDSQVLPSGHNSH